MLQIELKRLLPFCDVDAIVTSCPRLVLREDWPVVVTAVQELRKLYASEDDIGALVQQNPVILHQDVPYVISELQRYARVLMLPEISPVSLVSSTILVQPQPS